MPIVETAVPFLFRFNFRRVLLGLSLIAFVAAIFYICGFKLMDMDFWWHIKSGEIILNSKSMIAYEPFAYTRPGQPYLPTYEWLSQVVLYLLYTVGGPTGMIIFRTVMIGLVFFIFLSLDWKNTWPNAFFAIFAADAIRRGTMVRPQLFTYVFFAFSIWLAIRYLQATSQKHQRFIAVAWIGLQIIWVNFHGAAALLGFAVVGAVFCQELFNRFTISQANDSLRYGERNNTRLLIPIPVSGYVLTGLLLASFVSPNLHEHFTYLFKNQPTILLVSEWQPRPFPMYLKEIGIFWVVGAVAVILGRGKIIFSSLLLLATGIASLKAFRHEMLFVIATTGVTFFELKHSHLWQKGLGWLNARGPVKMTVFLVAGLFLAVYGRLRYEDFARARYLYGYGTFAPAKGAYEFLERENIKGPMFNAYGIGGYLAFRGYPHRPTFIDGRSADHGVELMWKTYQAGKEETYWNELEKKFGFTYAVIDYDQDKEPNYTPYCVHLGKNPAWALAFIDDGGVVYLKDTPANRPVIERHAYKVLTPEILDYRNEWDKVPQEMWPAFEVELRRMNVATPDCFKAKLSLARQCFRTGRTEEAETWANEALKVRPYTAEPHEILAGVSVRRKNWPTAARHYEEMLTWAGDLYPNINYGPISQIFELAGRPVKALWYRKKVGKESLGKGSVAAATDPFPKKNPETEKKAKALMEELQKGWTEDRLAANDKGVELTEKGELKKAREQFLSALKIDPGYPEALNNLGSGYFQEKNFEEAARYYEKALARNPDYADAHYNLALCLVKVGQPEKALEHAEKANTLGRNAERIIAAINRQMVKTGKTL